MNIIITNIGRRGYLVDYIKQIDDFDGKVYVSDCDKTASGLYGNNDGHFILSRPVDDEQLYIQQLKELCIKMEIALVIPVIDPEIYILSKNKHVFEESGITVLVSDEQVLDICYNKILMNQFLEKEGFCYPKTYIELQDFEKDYELGKVQFPIFVKPIYGSGSVETFMVKSEEELKIRFHDGLMIQEYISGEEFGIDVFNTLEKKPVRCVVKKKISMRSGETDKSLTVKDKTIQSYILNLAEKLGHVGNLDCDILKCGETLYIIDLNPRFGGGYPATHVAGVNLIKLIIDMVNGEIINADFENYQENLLVMKEIGIKAVLV